MTAKTFDVAIAGGGPAGSAAAIALSGKGRSVLLIERTNYAAPRIGESLPPRARLPLTKLGAWDSFVRARHLQSPGTIAAWGSAELSANDLVLNPYGCGWHLDRAVFDKMLSRRASDVGATVLHGATVMRVRDDPNGWRVETDAGVQRARFLVDATGRVGLVARQLGIPRVNHDHLVGIAGFFHAHTQDTRTLVEAACDGWWYSALLPNGRLIVAFMTDADVLPALNSQLRQFWERQLAATRHTRTRMAASAVAPTLFTLAANSYRLTHVAGEEWLAVGDAASGLDPLSSQGLYHALESGLTAGHAIDRCLRGDGRSLKEYAERAERAFARYLQQRADYYAREERWRDAPFWKRRRAVSATTTVVELKPRYKEVIANVP